MAAPNIFQLYPVRWAQIDDKVSQEALGKAVGVGGEKAAWWMGW